MCAEFIFSAWFGRIDQKCSPHFIPMLNSVSYFRFKWPAVQSFYQNDMLSMYRMHCDEMTYSFVSYIICNSNTQLNQSCSLLNYVLTIAPLISRVVPLSLTKITWFMIFPRIPIQSSTKLRFAFFCWYIFFFFSCCLPHFSQFMSKEIFISVSPTPLFQIKLLWTFYFWKNANSCQHNHTASTIRKRQTYSVRQAQGKILNKR